MDYPTGIGDRYRPIGDDAILLRDHVQEIAGHGDRSVGLAGRRTGSSLAYGPDVAIEVRVLAITRYRCPIRSDLEPRLARVGEYDLRRIECGRVVIRIVLRAPGDKRLPDKTILVEVHGLEIIDEHVGIVAARPVERRTRDAHLRIEPVGQGGECAEQQYRRPSDESTEPGLRTRSHNRLSFGLAASASWSP